jgi:hypothetical protein
MGILIHFELAVKWPPSRHSASSAITATLVTLLTACQSQPDVDRVAHVALERRAWPATSVLVVERGSVLADVGHRTPPGRDPQDLVYPLGSIAKCSPRRRYTGWPSVGRSI